MDKLISKLTQNPYQQLIFLTFWKREKKKNGHCQKNISSLKEEKNRQEKKAVNQPNTCPRPSQCMWYASMTSGY